MSNEPQTNVLNLDEKAYKAAKRQIVESAYKVAKTPPTPVFDKNRLAAEIAAFEREGKVSAFSSTSSTSAPPTPKAPTSGSPSALSMTDDQYRQRKLDISRGKVPDFNASDAIHA